MQPKSQRIGPRYLGVQRLVQREANFLATCRGRAIVILKTVGRDTSIETSTAADCLLTMPQRIFAV